MSAQKVKIIVDSGAYSAWRLGKRIDLDAYCNYLLDNQDWITSYISLDVINPADTEAAAAASFENLKLMRKRGLNPMAVYHAGEDISWLLRMLDLGCDYIGIAASSLASRNAIDDWYGWCWSHMVTGGGLPVIRGHALGEGRYESLRRYPWYSADSTSWIYSAQRGGIATLPTGERIGMRNDGKSKGSVIDHNALSPEDRAMFDATLAEHGIAPKAFKALGRESITLRTYMTGLFYLKRQEQIRALHPIKHRPNGFLHRGASAQAPVGFERFDFYLVCGTNNMTFPIVAALQHTTILASYFYIDVPGDANEMSAGYKFKKLREFCADPIGTVKSVETWLKYWNILETHLNARI